MESAVKGPLEGIKVVELGQLIAAPFAGRILAEYGAAVVKVEPPGTGDPLRSWRKLHTDGTSLWSSVQSRNKQSVTADLRQEDGQEIARRLAAGADIVIENFRPGTLERWGGGGERLSALNPKLVMVRSAGCGQTGPYRDRPGFGAVGEAMGGIRHTTGFPDRPPTRVGVSLGDSLAALYAVVGALMGVLHVMRSGGPGQVVDVSLYESVFNVMESLVPEYDRYGEVRERTGSTLPGICPSNSYRCADDGYVIIAGNGDSIYQRLMRLIGRDDLADDPRLARNDGRVAHAEAIDAAIEDWTRHRPMAEALQCLEEARVPSGPVYTAADIAADPHYAAREMIVSATLPDGTPVRVPGISPKLSATPGGVRWLGPPLGAHTDEVLAALGYGETDISDLRARGVV